MTQEKKIPAEHGLPIIGSAVSFYRDMLDFQTKAYIKHNKSKVIETQFLNEKPLLLYGPEAHQWVLYDRDQLFSSHGGWEKQMGEMFPGAVLTMDGDRHRYQRRIMQTAFKNDVLKGYLSILNPSAEQSIKSWTVGDDFLVYPHMKQLLLEAAAPTFMGISLGASEEELLKAFIDCVQATIALIRYPIPPFKNWKGKKGRKKLEDFFYSMIDEKREIHTKDLFSQFCHAVSEEGDRYTDEEVVNHIIFLMMAAHDTTSGALTTIMYNLGKNIEWQEKLRHEVQKIEGDITYEDFPKLKYLSLAMKESIRLFPAVPVFPRRIVRDAIFDGYHIKAGTLVSLCVLHMHHDPDLWENPELFDPMRFTEERAEHKEHRFKYVPFGGGAHMCIGQRFAEMQVKVTMSKILKNYRWELPEDYVMEYQQVPITKPKDDLPIKLIPLN